MGLTNPMLCHRLFGLAVQERLNRFEQRGCVSRLEGVGSPANDQIVVAALDLFGFVSDLLCRDVMLREHQQHKTSNIGRNRWARPERRQRLPVYVGHLFAPKSASSQFELTPATTKDDGCGKAMTDERRLSGGRWDLRSRTSVRLR
jgi:hypothetical protein